MSTQSSVPAHLRNLTPQQREAVQAAAAQALADAPEWTETQLEQIGRLLTRDQPVTKKESAA